MDDLIPILWDNANNKDLVWIDNVRHEFKRFTFDTIRVKGSSLPWAKLSEVKDALAKTR